jgi:Helicase conserved C-terminal domain
MTDQASKRPDTAAVLSQLKDFQRDTVEYVFRRMYVDHDCARRFLIADEVGLGKTLVARGLIAKAIDHLWDRSQRIDIVYVCSNTDIARQNINRLNVTGRADFTLSSRITLLPITHENMQQSRLNFISFTPGTSFDLQSNPGWALERQLLYWLLKQPWSLDFTRATRVLHGNAGIDNFRLQVKGFATNTIHSGIADQFAIQIDGRPELRGRFEVLCDQMPKAGAAVPAELHWERNQLIGELRKALAQTCLHWLQPDLVILDEFQRFKHLLQGDGEEASEASQLAHHLFNYQESQDDPATAARVLLLSATPYKMYTLTHEEEQDDHYADFRNTLDFLVPEEQQRMEFRDELKLYREELYSLADLGIEGLLKAKCRLEASLKQVMVRTERLALTGDRNGMLVEVIPDRSSLLPSDLQQYLSLQDIARLIEYEDTLEFWKSAPYLLNFMDDYDLKRKFSKTVDSDPQPPKLKIAVQAAMEGLLNRRDIERYRQVDPGNSRLRYLHRTTIERGAWRLLWIPPSLPYYRGTGAFAEPELASFTKRLVFSCWRVVPKSVAAILSYDAERRMTQTFRKKARNTPEARKKRRPLLRFAFRDGRPTGMSVFGLIYPCWTFADRFDPLRFTQGDVGAGGPLDLDDLVQQIEPQISALLDPLTKRFVDPSRTTPDESWYWAAPLLLDRESDPDRFKKWLNQPDLAERWASQGASGDHVAAAGWRRHIEELRRSIRGKLTPLLLGPPPTDLPRIMAYVAIAGPGVVCLRAFSRLNPAMPAKKMVDLRQFAAPLAHSFLHLFNLPEVIALLRDRQRVVPYWQSVLEYCAGGNLQAVLDEYMHVLLESLGLVGKTTKRIAAGISEEIQRCLTLRTSTVQADVIAASKRRVRFEEPLRLRTRFAMRFGDQDAEDSTEPTRADHVRSAFNSPFWPFVLATTSVGQEGLDFHSYCHAVVHWNIPSNPVDLEQREGRVHRYKGHALRKNIAERFGMAACHSKASPWHEMFDVARQTRPPDQNDLFPFWVAPFGRAKIERHLPTLPHSREVAQLDGLRRALVIYRLVFGQNRQEDIVNYLLHRMPAEDIAQLMDFCRVDLAPPRVTQPSTEMA